MKQTLVALAFAATSLSAVASTDVYFAPNGGIKPVIIEELGKAEQHVEIAMYSLSDAGLIAKIKELAGAGVKVRMVLNAANEQSAKADDLEEAGVDVRYVNLIMHHKFALVDAPTEESRFPRLPGFPRKGVLLTGSMNWSTSAESSYDEDFLVFKNEPDLVRAFQIEFILMWNKSKDFSGAASNGEMMDDVEVLNEAPVLFTSSNFDAVEGAQGWSFRTRSALPDGVAGRAILDGMARAQRSIRIATTHFRRRDLYEGLVAALDRGVKVDLVLDGQEFDGRAPDTISDDESKFLDEHLARLGANVRYKVYSRSWSAPTAKQMHSKYMVVDDDVVLTGSLNWSENSELKTFENLLTLGSHAVRKYTENFDKIFSYRNGELDALIAEIQSHRGWSPCAFAPITLTSDEVARLRATYNPGACRQR